jgi:hypothetical protein
VKAIVESFSMAKANDAVAKLKEKSSQQPRRPGKLEQSRIDVKSGFEVFRGNPFVLRANLPHRKFEMPLVRH